MDTRFFGEVSLGVAWLKRGLDCQCALNELGYLGWGSRIVQSALEASVSLQHQGCLNPTPRWVVGGGMLWLSRRAVQRRRRPLSLTPQTIKTSQLEPRTSTLNAGFQISMLSSEPSFLHFCFRLVQEKALDEMLPRILSQLREDLRAQEGLAIPFHRGGSYGFAFDFRR